jgi:flagellar biosynthesis chaperone FliJ
MEREMYYDPWTNQWKGNITIQEYNAVENFMQVLSLVIKQVKMDDHAMTGIIKGKNSAIQYFKNSKWT